MPLCGAWGKGKKHTHTFLISFHFERKLKRENTPLSKKKSTVCIHLRVALAGRERRVKITLQNRTSVVDGSRGRMVEGASPVTPESPLEDDAQPSVPIHEGPLDRPKKSQKVFPVLTQTQADMHPAVFDAWLQLQRSQTLKVFNSGYQDFLKPVWLKPIDKLTPPRIGMVSAVVASPSSSTATRAGTQEAHRALQRLKHSALLKSDDQVRWEAMRKLKTLVLADPEASKLGTCLVSAVKLFTPESHWESSFSDAFHGKAVATLAKRAAALWRFSEWCIAHGLGPAVSATESVLYRYMEYLKHEGAPTTASSFLQAWTFLHRQTGLLYHSLEDILSSRVRGAARACLALKRPLQQAKPLTTRMVVALENVATQAPYEHWRIIAGHFLLCLGSCTRFGDSIHLVSLEVTQSNDIQLVEAESVAFKTAHSEERRKRLLPIISLGKFFARHAWAMDWMDLRAKHGLTCDPALPAFSEISSSWLERRMTTGEAQLYLREFLESSGFSTEDLERIGCHSLKCTLLSWVSKGDYLSIPDRLVMGHHLTKENQSAVVYARDDLTRLMGTVYQMCNDIKNKKFQPDASKAARVEHLIRMEAQDQDSDHDSEVESDAGIDAVAVARHPNMVRPSWDDMPLDLLNKLRVHRHSGVVHVLTQGGVGKFVCGRKYTHNFVEVEAGGNFFDMPICMQCRHT